MKAVVLAAGAGTRLRPFTSDRPKPMVEVAGEPAIGWILRWLAAESVVDVAVNLSHFPQVLRGYVGDGARFGVRVRYSVEPEVLGTSGALVPLRDFLGEEESFLVVYGDVLTDLPTGPLLSSHGAAGADATIVVTHVEDPTRAGIVAFGEDHRITRLVEKPRRDEVFSSWANAGIYVCGRRVWDYLPTYGFQDFAHDLFPAMLRDGRGLLAYPTDATIIDYGAPERLELASAWVRSREALC